MFLDSPRLACRNFAKRCSAGSCIQLYSAVLLQISSHFGHWRVICSRCSDMLRFVRIFLRMDLWHRCLSTYVTLRIWDDFMDDLMDDLMDLRYLRQKCQKMMERSVERSVERSRHEPWGLAKQNLLGELSTVLVELRGSLALTGIGHGTNKAIRSDPEIKTGSTDRFCRFFRFSEHENCGKEYKWTKNE
jgi:hypothetical protein